MSAQPTARHDAPQMQVQVILNPTSGDKKAAEAIYASNLKPLLDKSELRHVLTRTEKPGHASQIVQDFLSQQAQRKVVFVLLGGDGTTHETLNGVHEYFKSVQGSAKLPTVELAIVPTGTANALYAGLYPPSSSKGEESGADDQEWRLKSFRSLLASLTRSSDPASSQRPQNGELIPLTMTLATLSSSTSSSQDVQLISHLITSHAFHASILQDSDSPELREKYPGIERFKVAAGMNVLRWTNFPTSTASDTKSERAGTVRLLPYASEGLKNGGKQTLQKYDGRTRAWKQVKLASEGAEAGGHLELDGPFFYFASLTTDRLEPTFVPGPFSAPYQASGSKAAYEDMPDDDAQWSQLRKTLSRPPQAVDVVIVRPLLDPILAEEINKSKGAIDWSSPSSKSHELRQRWAGSRLGDLTKAMYSEGRHVQLTYPTLQQAQSGQGKLAMDGEGPYIVEYFRTGGYVWIAVSAFPSKLLRDTLR